MSKSKTTSILNGAYKVVGIVPGPVGTPIGLIDLSKISESTAERLIAIRFAYLRRASKPKKAKEENTDTEPVKS